MENTTCENESVNELGVTFMDHCGYIIVGTTYISLPLLFACLYIPCLIVVIKDKELWVHSSYQIMVHLGFADLIQLFCHVS